MKTSSYSLKKALLCRKERLRHTHFIIRIPQSPNVDLQQLESVAENIWLIQGGSGKSDVGISVYHIKCQITDNFAKKFGESARTSTRATKI